MTCSFGEKLHEARTRNGWSQEKLAAKLGVQRTHISRLENGTVSPSFELLCRLGAVLGLDLGSCPRRSRRPTPLRELVVPGSTTPRTTSP